MKTKLPIDTDIKAFLDEKVLEYNNPAFVEFDPISVPHRYSLKEDIEIAGFLAATISWGSRPQIVRAGHKIMDIMGDSPFDFLMSHSQRQMERFDGFVYRTFNSDDLKYFIGGLRHIYKKHGGIEQLFIQYATDVSLQPAIHHFRNHFFEPKHMNRTEKHISDPFKGSAAKKINILLRVIKGAA